MKTVFKTRLCAIACLLLLTLSVSAVSVFAKISDADIDKLVQESETFLNTVYTMPDEGLDQLRENGGFYEVLVRAWYEDREIVGKYGKIVSSEAERGDKDQLIINSVVEFEKYTSDVVIYFDSEKMSPINYVMNIRYSMKEKMTQAAQNMAVGLIVVFAVLVFLMFIIFLFRFIAPRQDKKQESAGTQPAAASAPADTAEGSPEPLQTAAGNATEEEIAAVIAAAIAAASEEAPSPGGYVVRSVHRKHSGWKRV